MESVVGLIVLLAIVVVCLAITFLPAIIAYRRKHNQKLAIFMLTLFTGWTFIGWVVAIVWASTSDVEDKKDQK
ncbi:immunity to superinfection [Cronobacter phage S13]|uniref:Superinfection immunity protein n=1 Tax=Cronobacter phage LPCS28 TaxID=2924885 RepID=A0AAE9K651_9CAUD|nr:immunity to superinfection [Cronobacter phage S13]YP_010665810.1 immunity to superinfection [Cronobacter phage LPCS28]AIA65027.1 hypothetical protein S13_230 [Cronobacter phage S13]UNY46999.1 hypothetical protein EHEKIMEA_00117 [Cronobacter phage LPCS28]